MEVILFILTWRNRTPDFSRYLIELGLHVCQILEGGLELTRWFSNPTDLTKTLGLE